MLDLDGRHAVPGSADDGSVGNRLRRAETVLGLREGATENATVVSSLLSELVERDLDFSTPRLYILDGSKALHAAVKRHAGDASFIQRCQVHKAECNRSPT